GDAAAGGQHHAEARVGILLEDAGDALHAGRIGDARAAKLMYAPPLHVRAISCCQFSASHAPRARIPPRAGAAPGNQRNKPGRRERWEPDTLLTVPRCGKQLASGDVWTCDLGGRRGLVATRRRLGAARTA